MERCSSEDFLVKEIKPNLGGAVDFGSAEVNGNHRLISSYDLVEPMHYLYIRIVKAKDLLVKEVAADTSSLSNGVIDSSCDPYAGVKLGNYKRVTQYFKKTSCPQWNHVFGFSKSRIQDSEVEVRIMDNGSPIDPFMGRVLFELDKVPKIVPPQTPLSPRWYKLEDRNGNKVDGEVMLAIWFGTQADEAFSEGWLSDATGAYSIANVRSKLYVSPKLWYLRVNAIEAQDLVLSKMRNSPEIFVKATVGNQALETKLSSSKSINPFWNEDLMFVVAEPFEEPLVLSVTERVESNKEEILGRCVIHLKHAEKSLDHRDVRTRWFKLETDNVVEEGNNVVKFASRINTRICLESGYHVKDESNQNSSNFQPADEQLWKSSIGVLEVGILRAQGLSPMKFKRGRGTTDAYCVAKYGQEWARTRTICDSLFPKWNEQYDWKVFDPCTVLTIGVFDNCHFLGGDKDSIIGKVRIRVSTLESGHVYTHSYPLLVLLPSGLKKTGEIQLAVRFVYHSMFSMMKIYSQPLLPEKHYSHPLTSNQIDILRCHASQLISTELSHAEPPLKKEVLQYMLEVDSNLRNMLTVNSNLWSLRRSKANFFRLMSVLNVFFVVWRWFDEIRNWKNPMMTILIHILVIFLVWCPQLILPSIFLYFFLGRVWYYRWRPMQPPHVNALLSGVNDMHPDELDEEFDTFPTSRPSDIVLRMRYDRLRSINGRMQTLVGELASQGERIQSLLGWRDPRPTILFTIICLGAAIFLYITPFQVVALLTGLYILRHPILRSKRPSMLLNCFRRLPAGTDCML